MDGLKKILDLIKKTGDRVIVLEMPSQTAYAVMNLDDYERLWQSSRRRADQELALWRHEQEEETESEEEKTEDERFEFGQEELPGLVKKDDEWFGEDDWLAEEKEENEEEIEEKEEKDEEEKTEDERYYFESLEP